MINIIDNHVLKVNGSLLFILNSQLRVHHLLLVIRSDHSPVLFSVIERALIDLSALDLRARSCLIVEGVVLLLFPTMGSQASRLQDTAFFILSDKSTGLPVLTELMCIVVKDMGFSSEILPVMRIITLGLIVFFVKWAPLSLKVKLVVVCILLHQMYDSGLQVDL